MHFGLHLKKKGTISAEQLVSALDVQLSTLVPIGQLALEEGMLTPRNIFEVLLAQSQSPHVRFGDLAVELGLLTRDDVMRLLMIQADRKRAIGEILVEQGVLNKPQLQAELAAYRRAQLQPKRPSATIKYVPMPLGKSVSRPTADAITGAYFEA
jgi:hypothetical protein